MTHVPDIIERQIMIARKQRMIDRETPFFECPDCGAVSPHPDDIANQFCFRCREFKGDRW